MAVVGGFSICSSPGLLEKEGVLELAIKRTTHPPAHWIHTQVSKWCFVYSVLKGNCLTCFTVLVIINCFEALRAISVSSCISFLCLTLGVCKGVPQSDVFQLCYTTTSLIQPGWESSLVLLSYTAVHL